jgi:hypothetical protein
VFAVLTVLAGVPLPPALRLPALLLFLLLAVRTWRRRSELGGAPVSLVWEAGPRWWWRQGGREEPLRLRGDSYRSARLVVLSFLPPQGGRRSLIVLPSTVGEETFRRLQVRLQLEPPAEER